MVEVSRNCPGACRRGGVELSCFHITFLFFLFPTTTRILTTVTALGSKPRSCLRDQP